MKFLLVIFTILISGMFVFSQNAYAVEWYWTGSGTTNDWSDIANWECRDVDFNLIPCPAPGYPETLLTNPDPDLIDKVFIDDTCAGGPFTVNINVPFILMQPLTEINICSSTVTSTSFITIQKTGFDAAVLTVIGSSFTSFGPIDNSGNVSIDDSDFTNGAAILNSPTGNFAFIGSTSNILTNSPFSLIQNDGFFGIDATKTVRNFGIFDTSLGILDNFGQIFNECDSQFLGTVSSGNDPIDNCVSNNPPIAVDDSYSTDEDTQLTVLVPGVLANDSDPDGDPLTAHDDTTTSNGGLTLNPDGSFTYTPNSNYNGNDIFTYHANDGTEDSNIATVTITVISINDPPVAIAQDVTAPADSNCLATVEAKDVDNGSSDPDGDPISLDLDPQGPYSLGDSSVNLIVTDNSGASSSDSATISVIDDTEPGITAALEPIDVKKKKGLFRVQVAADDNCDSDVSISADINGVPVENGDLVLLKIDDEHEVENKSYSQKQCDGFQKQADRYENRGKNIPDKLEEKLLVCEAGGLIKIEDSSFLLTATGTDDSGNSNTVTVEPDFGSTSQTQKISGTFVGKHDGEEFKTKGHYKIGDQKFKRISGSGDYEIKGDEKCRELSALNTLELGGGDSITMHVDGEICQKKHLSTFKGSFVVTQGEGKFDDATGNGDVSLIIGKKHFGGKISGEVFLS